MDLLFYKKKSKVKMRYLGSKYYTVNSIYEIISARIQEGTFCDPFGGMGIVGSFFKSKNYSVYTGDLLTFAYFFQIARIGINHLPSYSKLLNYLELSFIEELIQCLNADEAEGWFVEEYSKMRSFFTEKNARKIESCRLKLNEWSSLGLLDLTEHAVLYASFINSVDKVANTAGTYYAYLKTWHRKALLPFKFELLAHTRSRKKCYCHHLDAFELVGKKSFDVLYLDPPYNERHYAQYYHLPETLALGETPALSGKSGMSLGPKVKSGFNYRSQAKESLDKLIARSSFKLLLFHYSDEGLITPEETREILSRYGEIEEIYIDSKGYTTSNLSRTTQHHIYVVTP
jgi:adenine-specific DNA-methyltransferase